MPNRTLVALLAGLVGLAGLSVTACGTDATIGDAPPGAGAGGGFGSAQGDAGTGANKPGANGPETRAAFCASGGSGIVIPGTSDCTGDLASKTFRFGVCSCESITTNGNVRTRSFDSTKKQSLATGGSIGTNGDLGVNGASDIGGSVWAAGRVVMNDDGHVFEELRAGAGASANGVLTVDRDYWGGTPLLGDQGTVVKGASHVPAAVASPCDCTNQIPIDRIVKAFETDNDDAASNLSPDRLAGGTDDVDLTLECGRYYFSSVTTNGKVTLRLKGRTAIFIGGDVIPNGGLDVIFEGGAELDLFVVGDLRLNGNAVFGDLDAPARVRVYAKGDQVSVNGDARLAGNLYAPNAKVGINGDQVTRGAIYAKGVSTNGGLAVEYDEAILKVKGCNTGSTCGSCKDCGGATPACKGGTCGACETNADCCAPLVCQAGACVPSVR